MIISPIFYMGNKKKLINKGLVELFPKDINLMVDLFGGTAIVSMNTTANEYYVNDLNDHLFNLYNLFKDNNADDIIKHIENRIEEFNLAKERTKRNVYTDKDKIEKYKNAYMNFRAYANKNQNIFDFYTLQFFAFSQQFRFNNKGEFNMPCGNDCFSEMNKQYIEDGCKFFSNSNVAIDKIDFREFDINTLNSDDFVYLDPPYLDTTATYNENGGWTIKDEDDVYKLCEELNNKGIKFALSNVFENKGIKNEKIIKWCENNNWNVYTFDRFTYMACGRGNSNAKEVLIRNY